MNVIIRFTKFRFTLPRVLRFQSKVVVMADQIFLDAINIGEKNLLDTITIDEPLDISLVRITQNTPVRNTQEMPALTKKKQKRIKKVSLLSRISRTTSIRNVAIYSLIRELLQKVQFLIQNEENGIISFLKNQNDQLLTEVSFLHEKVKEKNIVLKKLTDNCQRNCRQNINCDISNN